MIHRRHGADLFVPVIFNKDETQAWLSIWLHGELQTRVLDALLQRHFEVLIHADWLYPLLKQTCVLCGWQDDPENLLAHLHLDHSYACQIAVAIQTEVAKIIPLFSNSPCCPLRHMRTGDPETVHSHLRGECVVVKQLALILTAPVSQPPAAATPQPQELKRSKQPSIHDSWAWRSGRLAGDQTFELARLGKALLNNKWFRQFLTIRCWMCGAFHLRLSHLQQRNENDSVRAGCHLMMLNEDHFQSCDHCSKGLQVTTPCPILLQLSIILSHGVRRSDAGEDCYSGKMFSRQNR